MEIFTNINNYLSSLPWWVISLGTAFLVVILKSRPKPAVDLRAGSRHAVSNHTHRIIEPTTVGSTVTTVETSFEGEDANQLLEMIRNGNKIGAIKLVRQLKNLDLVDAKNMVEAMEKGLR